SGESDLSKRLQQEKIFTVPVALSVMVFFALCCQCVSTLAVIRRETHSWRWPIFTFVYMTVLAYLGALVVYQVGSWFSESACRFAPPRLTVSRNLKGRVSPVDWQLTIVIPIVTLSAFYVIWVTWITWTGGRKTCGGSCACDKRVTSGKDSTA